MQVPTAGAPEADESASAVSRRPSIVIVGPPNVGKHSLLKRTPKKISNFQFLRHCIFVEISILELQATVYFLEY